MIHTSIEERIRKETYPHLGDSFDECSTSPILMPPPESRLSCNDASYEPDDSKDQIPQFKFKFTIEPFTCLSRVRLKIPISLAYSMNREIMMTLDNTDPIKTLPKSLSTLRKNFLEDPSYVIQASNPVTTGEEPGGISFFLTPHPN
jgi:hypothetical protein